MVAAVLAEIRPRPQRLRVQECLGRRSRVSEVVEGVYA